MDPSVLQDSRRRMRAAERGLVSPRLNHTNSILNEINSVLDEMNSMLVDGVPA